MTQNRKRGRSVYEDEIEFVPLSKRINNLHINNTLLGPASAWSRELPGLPTPPEPALAPDCPWGRYAPELSEAENPYYYGINKLLYEMEVVRQQRARNGI